MTLTMARELFGPLAALVLALRQLWRVGLVQPPKQSPAVSSKGSHPSKPRSEFTQDVLKAVLSQKDAGRPEVIEPDSPLKAEWRRELEGNLRRAILNGTPPSPDWQHDLGERAKAGMRVAAMRGSATDWDTELDKQKARVMTVTDVAVEHRPAPGLLLPEMERFAGLARDENNLPGLRRRGYGDDDLAAAWNQARQAIAKAAAR